MKENLQYADKKSQKQKVFAMKMQSKYRKRKNI